MNQELTFYGDNLEKSINEVQYERPALIENLLYEKSALLIYADDGVGKSIVALQICMQSTIKDAKVFGLFNADKACKVIYFQMERHTDESFERMRHLRNVLPFDLPNFVLSVELQGVNLQNNESLNKAFKKVDEIISRVGFIPDIMVFEPIYTLVPDDLSTAPACNAITSFFRVLQLKTGATILATSHTNRGVRDRDTHKRVGKDMYGSRFLSAFFTGSYHLEPKKDGFGSVWTLDKNSQKNLEKKIDLTYDPSCYRSWTSGDERMTKLDKLNMFIQTCKNTQKEFSFDDMLKFSDLSDSMLRRYLSSHLKNTINISTKLSRGKILYRVG